MGQFRILITIIPPYPERDGDDARAMLQANGYPLFAAGIRQAKGFKMAALRGLLINQLKGPRAALCWDDYAKVGAELLS